eukprot:c27080_g1_i1 orf=243-1739(-)
MPITQAYLVCVGPEKYNGRIKKSRIMIRVIDACDRWLLIASLFVVGLTIFMLFGRGILSSNNVRSSSLVLQSIGTQSKLVLEEKVHEIASEMCHGRYIYVYLLPPEFNDELVEKCHKGGNWFDMCGVLENSGFGGLVPQSENKLTELKLLPASAWYRTEQFSLEVLFHDKIKRYPCLTSDPARANAFYIPFYAALDAAFTLFSPHIQIRDRLSQRLLGWLSSNPIWRESKGQRHFMVLGRIAWDFSREEHLDGWGSALLTQPELANITRLVIERRPWTNGEVAVPYPTSFHPSSDEELTVWKETLRRATRDRLVTFVGSANRGFNTTKLLRKELIKQCNENNDKCTLVQCSGEGGLSCSETPEKVIQAFTKAVFCLQPRGDSPTRKGLFDSIIAGCIPVLFANSSAYQQYIWHLPKAGSLYSVYFPEDDVVEGKINIISSLSSIPQNQVQEMQRAVINLLPRVIYSRPGARNSSAFTDAFDVALESYLKQAPIPAAYF